MKKRVLKIALIAIAIIAGGGGAAFGYFKYTSAQKEIATLKHASSNSSEDQTKKENEKLISQVKSLVELPGDEAPTIATVNDASKVKEQPFFSRSENGDRVIIYTKSKKAILYRPSSNKIIEIAPITISQSATPSGQVAGAKTSPTPTPKPTSLKVLLLNGTNIPGVTSKFETSIKSSYPKADITKESANKTDYEKSEMVALSDAGKTEVSKLSSTLSIATVTDSPYGEDLAGRADIAIIIGKDKSQ